MARAGQLLVSPGPWCARERATIPRMRRLALIAVFVAGLASPAWADFDDGVAAYMWYSLAASQGIEVATRHRHQLAKSMPPDDVPKAQRLAREWVAKF